MTAPSEPKDADDMRHWWRTAIIDMAPGRIAFRGHPIQDLIGSVSFAQMIHKRLRLLPHVWPRPAGWGSTMS